MNKTYLTLSLCAIAFAGCNKEDKNMHKEGDLYIVNTTEIGKDIQGFKGAVPCIVEIKADGTVNNVEICDNNQETPRFVERVKEDLLPRLQGIDSKTIKEVDGVTGATFTSNAVIRNTDAALKYYEAKK